MTEVEKYHKAAGKIQNSEKSQMFGKPCYKLNGKAFCCFFENEMVFKLTEDAHLEALSLDGSKLFDPSGKGRAMKEWVQVSFHYSQLWDDFAKAAANYISRK